MFDKAYMELHGYLEALIGSKTSISLVRALINHPGKVFTVRKLAETAKVSASEAAMFVQQLEKYCVMKIQPVGRSYMLTLNEESYVLNKILKPMIKAESETLHELISILQDSLSRSGAKNNIITSTVLFGSVAARQEREDSDVDLLVISDDFDAATALVSKAQERISLAFNIRLSPLIMNQKELINKKNDRLIQSIIDNYITVSGKDVKELLEDND
jgi:predicted nucleotidyltransferase